MEENEYDCMVVLSTSVRTGKSSHFLDVVASSGYRSVNSAV